MNYQWRVVRLGLQDELNNDGVLLQNSIVDVRWKKIATDTDGTSASYLGQTTLTAKDVPAANFINFGEVTEAVVLEWVQNSLDSADINRIDKALQKKIEKNRIKTQKPNW